MKSMVTGVWNKSGKEYGRETAFWLSILLFAFIKQWMAHGLPAYAIPNAGYDDGLMVYLAQQLYGGNWLGEYSVVTLVKGISFPAFLALCKWIGLSFIDGETLFYTTSVIVFILSMRQVFKNRLGLLLLYLFLLFNPVTFGMATLQRVYRNGITVSQTVVIFSCVIAMYFRRDKKWTALLPWGVLYGVMVPFFWFNREDSIWILPFLMVASLIMGIYWLKKKELFKVLLLFLPLAGFLLTNNFIKAENNKYYGVKITNELQQGSFPLVMENLYRINPENKSINPKVAITRESLTLAETASPKLRDLLEDNEVLYQRWDDTDLHPSDGEIENGWFFWYLRDCASSSGYYEQADISESLWREIHEELENGFDNGMLPARRTMPSALMGPWKKGYGSLLLDAIGRGIPYTVTFSQMAAEVNISEINSPDFIDMTRSMIANEGTDEETLARLQRACDRSNAVIYVYRVLSPVLTIASVLIYLGWTICLVKNKLKPNGFHGLKRTGKQPEGSLEEYMSNGAGAFDIWLIASSILFSYVVLLCGVSYNDVASCGSIDYMYLSGTYPLILMFDGILLYSTATWWRQRFGRENSADTEYIFCTGKDTQ